MALKYSAKLLFYYENTPSESARKTVLCEERIVVFKARGPKQAISMARKKGRKSEFSYENAFGERINFKFAGIMDLTDLEICEEDEVWYDLRRYKFPFENRKTDLIKSDEDLLSRT